MSTWPAVADLGDITRLPFRPFRPVEPAPLRDPALLAEMSTEELLAETRQILADLDAAMTRTRRARGADTDLGQVA